MQRSNIAPTVILAASPVLIVCTVVLSVLYGAKSIDAGTIRDAIFHFNPDDVNHQIIVSSRLPRVIGALLIGAFLAVSGALMQGMTRNDLASPSVLGVTDGSAFIITLSMIFLPDASAADLMLFSFAGSALGVAVVFGLASILPGGLSPVRLAIIGTVIGTFMSSASAALSTYFQISLKVGFWFNSRLHQMDPAMLKLAVPCAIAGITAAVILSRSISILSLGEEISSGLGQRTLIVKLLGSAVVVVLTGMSVALAGKIAFVGLIVPHIVRFLVGLDYRWIIPCSGVLGAVFLALCDVLCRFLNSPYEMPVGVVTALIGVPFFLYLARTKGGKRGA